MSPVLTLRSRRRLILLFVLSVVCAAKAVALPLSDYHRNIQRAIATLEAMNEYDAESSSDFEMEFAATLHSVRTALPESQTVEWKGEVYTVDNKWLHRSLDDLKKPADRSDTLAHLLETL